MSTRLSHPLLRFILFFALSLTVALPTTALAAPVKQPTAEATLLAYFESDGATDAEGKEVVIGLSFYDDDTFEMSLDYLDGEDSSLVYGDYEENDDGVLLSATGADGEDFGETVEVELLWDADDTLIIVGSPDAPLGEEDIILYPVDVDDDADDIGDDNGDDTGDDTGDDNGDDTGNDTGDDTGNDTGDDTGDDFDDSFLFEVGGVYISPIQPSDISDGVVYMLNLQPGGDASLSSDYLDLEPPIFEVGTWTDNGDNTATVEITGTPEEEYDETIIIELEVGEFGELVVGEIYLYPLQILTFLSEDDAGDNLGGDDLGDDLDDEEGEVFIFVAEVTPPDEDEPTYIYLFLYEDGTVAMTDEAESETLFGEWTIDDDDILTVTITGNTEEEFDEAVDLVFEFDDDALVATEYPIEVFGEDGLIFYPAEDEGDDDEAVSEGEFYFYESDILPSENTDGIVISVVLSADGAVVISTDYMDDEEPFLEYGEWTVDDDGAIVVTINESQDSAYEEPYVFTFEEDDDDFSLVLVEESIEVFGEAGLVLHRVE